MALNYPDQQELVVLGTVDDTVIPEVVTPVTLTTSFTDNVSDPYHMEHFAQLTFFVEYTTGAGGAGNSVDIKVEGSPDLLQNDSITPIYYQETASLTVGGTITHTTCVHEIVNSASATTKRAFFYVPPAYKTIRVSAKENVVGGSAGTLIVRVLTSGK